MGNEKLYLAVTNEVNSDERDPALWAKSLTLTEGDEEKAKYKYIKLRIEDLSSETKDCNSPEGNIERVKKPYPWKILSIWIVAIFVACYIGIKPPEDIYGNIAIGFKIVFASIFTVVGGVIVGIYKYFRR
jgi:hypothetical protein